VQGSFITGFTGVVAPPFERAYLGGENDIRGFDIRTVSPIAYLPSVQAVPLKNPDGSFVPANPALPVVLTATGACAVSSNCYLIKVPFSQITTPGGDLSLNGNLEYRITIAGPVALAPFVDVGVDPIIRTSQLQIAQAQFNDLRNTQFGCPILPPPFTNCQGTTSLKFSQFLSAVPGTNWVPRMSTGLELQMMLPVINAPFRIYWAYNAMRLNSNTAPPVPISLSMFTQCDPNHPDPVKCQNFGAAKFTFQNTQDTLGLNYTLREPRKTFRFSVATTF
jgi:outer membrane protein insertion porin family